jgi:hypothetical protein
MTELLTPSHPTREDTESRIEIVGGKVHPGELIVFVRENFENEDYKIKVANRRDSVFCEETLR